MILHHFNILRSNLRAIAKETVLRGVQIASKVAGVRCLSRQETLEFSNYLGVVMEPGKECIFQLDGLIHNLAVMSCGVVKINRSHLLLTDFGNRGGLVDFKKIRQHISHAAALWSHSDSFFGYYHYLAEIAPKICLLQEKYGKKLDGITLCYPRSHRPYESEILSLLEVPGDRIHDTSSRGGVTAEMVSVVAMEGWFGAPTNLDLLRRRLLPKAKGNDGGDFLYIRRRGRRRCLNEEDFLPSLIAMGFTVIEDEPKSVSEQIAFYRRAKVIMGPHGGGFTNMIWSEPGVMIIELMPSRHNTPYYEVLSKVCGHHYHKILCLNGEKARDGIEHDFLAPVKILLEKAAVLIKS